LRLNTTARCVDAISMTQMADGDKTGYALYSRTIFSD